MFKPLFAAAAAAAALVAVASLADDPAVDYPDGYRHWTHLKSMVIRPDHPLADPFAGIHHVYANDEALAGLDDGDYADGAVFVFDLLAYEDAGDALTEGARKFIGVMAYDAGRHAATGGWGFEAFAGDSDSERLVADGGAGCFGCHQAVRASGYVFSTYRE